MRNITKFTGLDSAFGIRIVIVDVNNDDYPDLLWGTGNIGKNNYHLYLNIENPDKSSPYRRIFKDFTAESGINKNRDIAKIGRIIDVAAMADVDNDGDMDLVTSIYYHRLENYKDTLDPGDRSEVYLNDGSGHFTLMRNNGLYDMNVLSFLPKGLINATGLSFLDYDLDGKIDLYISTWFSDRTNGIGMPDMLFHGNGDGSFTNTDMPIIKANYYPMYGVNATDWDNDGWPDILTSPYCNSNGNLFRNMHDGTFQDYSAQANYSATDMTGDNGQALCQWEAQPADYDNDGDMDLLQVFVHGGYHQNEGRTRICTNLGADSGYKYKPDINLINRDAPTNSHLGDQGGQWFDLNGDGYMDIVIGQMAYPSANTQGQERLYICLQYPDKTPRFQDISKSLGIFGTIKEAHSMEPLDFDLDGDQDLLVSHQVRDTVWKDTIINGITTKIPSSVSAHMQIVLLENKTTDIIPIGSDYHRWISVKLNPPLHCNRSGIGARIKVYSNGNAYMQDIQSGLGHFSGQQPFIRNFGFGYNPANIDSISVIWPDRNHSTTVVKGVPLNTIVTIDSSGYSSFKKTWTMKKPVLAINNSRVNFGKVNVGDKKSISFTLKNLGDNLLIIDKISDFINSDLLFSPAVNYPITISAGEKINITIDFKPAKRELISGNLIINSNAYNDSLAVIYYDAYGFENQPMISIINDSISFGKTFIDSIAVRDIIVKNTGELDLHISKIDVTGLPSEFQFINLPAFPVIIKPNQQTSFRIEFSPKEEITYKAIVVLNSNAYNEDNYHITVNGEGVLRRPQIAVTNPLVIFGSIEIGETKEKSLHISNTGTADLIVNDIKFEKKYDSIYVKLFTLPQTIKPMQEADLTFRFKPVAVQSYKTEVYLHSNSISDSVFVLNFMGSGKEPTDVAEDNTKNLIQIIPNPGRGLTDIVFSNENTVSREVSVYDILGNKILAEYKINNSSGKNIWQLDTKNFANGVYLIVLSTSSGNFVRTLIVD